MPASIDYVRDFTGQEKVSYMGHSQGTSQMFYALAVKEDFWKERINVFIACAPVIMPNKHFKLFGFGSRVERGLDKTLRAVKLWELFGANWEKTSRTLRTLIPGFTWAES